MRVRATFPVPARSLPCESRHRAGGRYWGLEKAEGIQRWSMVFRPGWRPWALGGLFAGAIASVALLLGAVTGPTRGPTNA